MKRKYNLTLRAPVSPRAAARDRMAKGKVRGEKRMITHLKT
jgi:hypothetical protein